MTKEELEKEATLCVQAYLIGAELREKQIKELEKRICVLLSCQNCPDNKGGFICQKEYEDKCLAQKIQYIKELKEENTELEKENAELNDKLIVWVETAKIRLTNWQKLDNELRKAKETIRMIIDSYNHKERFSFEKDLIKAEQFLKEVS
jgi:hypothetical protein